MTGGALYLIDGNALLYRSYYAIQRLSNSQGFPTNAIYGFIIALRKILDEAKPEYLGIVFDSPGPKYRQEIFKDYKAQRKPMPDDLVKQVPRLKEVLTAFRIPLFENSRYEADDVLGSLAVRAAASNLKTVIVTTDKDLFQLVDANTSVYNPSKDILLDEAKVKEFFGVSPAQVVDVLTLWGDPSDNIPGVPGVGEKTAKSLISEFGSLDALLANLDTIANARARTAIRDNMDKLEMSRKLALIERDLDIVFDLEAFRMEEPDIEEVTRLFRELEFTALLQEYARKPAPLEKKYTTIFTPEELRALVGRIREAGRAAVDTETDNVSPTRARLVGMSFSVQPDEAFYLPLRHDYMGAPAQIPAGPALDIVRGVLEDPDILWTGQNIKYDLIVLGREGIRWRGIDLDTMILSYLLEPNWGRHNLDRLALAYLGQSSIPFKDIVGKGKSEITMNKAPVESVTPYACQDADFALTLGRLLWPRVENEKLDRLYRDIEQPLIAILAEMETAGVRIDSEALRVLAEGMDKDLRRLEKEITELAGTAFNINSPQQLSQVLFHKLQIPLTKKTKGTKNFSTSMDILEDMAELHPIIRKVVEFRQTSKLKSTYADALPALVNPETGRVHTSYNQTVASTGRLSSSDPNLQNIPARGEMGARFRRAFVPAEGCLFLAADYSQIELRVLAHMSEDSALVETFVRGGDIHQETADRVFGPGAGLFRDEQRHRAKIINFSVVYGTSAFSLAKQLGTNPAEAQKFIDTYYEKFPRVRAFLEEEVSKARTTGYSTTLLGRKRQVPELQSGDRNIREAGRRMALNTPIQGTAADLMKKAMIDVRRAIGRRGLCSRMILQVHDELVFEVPEDERETMGPLVREAMEGVHAFKVPLKVSLGWGRDWASCK
jgi:DNA polymerase-1